MQMSDHRNVPFDLEAFFEAEKNNPPEISTEFLAKIEADASDIQAGFDQNTVASDVTPSFWAALTAAIGGWPTIAGLATATVAGLWIGISPPQGLDSLTETILGSSQEYSDYLPNFDSVLTEG